MRFETLTTRSARPDWRSLALPSVADMIFLALLWVLVFTPFSVRLLGDAGIGWHIRTGQWILQTHSVPHVDPFSSTMQGKPWFAWEWLYDLVVGAIESHAGLDGVVLLNAAVIALVFAAVLGLLRRRGTGLFTALLLTVLAASASMVHFLARPHVLSWLFTVLWLGWLDDGCTDSTRSSAAVHSRLIWLLPVSMLWWVNLHGGFITGFVLLAAFLTGLVADWWRADHVNDFDSLRDGARLRSLGVAGIFSVLATLLNPYGWSLHAHIYRYLTNRWLMDHVQEFQSPNFHDPAAKCFVVLLASSIVAFGLRTRPIRISEYLLAIFACISGLYSARNIPVAAILLAYVAGPMLSAAFAQRVLRMPRSLAARIQGVSLRMSRMDAGLRGHLWPWLAIGLVALVASKASRPGNTSLIGAHFDFQRFPVTAVSQLNTFEGREPILTPDYWGGYLIYHLYPKRLVVVDDRHDLYGDTFFNSYFNMIRLGDDWNGFLNQHQVSLILLPKGSTLADGLILDRNWRVVYSDAVAILFQRDTSRNESIGNQ